MRLGKFLAATIAVLILIAAPATAQSGESRLTQRTRRNLLSAMQAEAFAYAKYLAFAEHGRDNRPELSRLFTQVATVERDDHFATEARVLGFGSDTVENLRVGIEGESQDVSDYGRWAAEATADGCRPAAELFAEVRRDEAGHLARFATALRSMVDPSSGATVPAPPPVEPVAVRAGLPRCDGRTLANLQAAMEGEAFVHLKYRTFAEHARRNGQSRPAVLFDATAAVELGEQFSAEANLAGLVRDDAANLRNAVEGETDDIVSYDRYAREADAAGDREAAALFREVRGDEVQHWNAFRGRSSSWAGHPAPPPEPPPLQAPR